MKTKLFLYTLVGLLSLTSAADNRLTINGNSLFMNGMNLAWNNFGNDFADVAIDENAMTEAIQKIRDAGGNSIRVWMFTNSVNSPKFDETTGLVSGLGDYTIANTQTLLNIADSNGVVVSLCLFSFDMMDSNATSVISENIKMLTTDSGTTAFINNALIPLVDSVGDHPSIMSWEIFNEPEGMIRELYTSPYWGGWADSCVNYSNVLTVDAVQKFTNKVAAAIHNHTTALVSSSITNMTMRKFWLDDSLIAAGGESNGTLDFFQVHYYPNYGVDSTSPFTHSADSWGIDKPIVIGEFPASSWDCSNGSETISEAYQALYDSGYAGALSWAYGGDASTSNGCSWTGNYDTAAVGMAALYAKDSAAIWIRDVTRASSSGNGVMEVDLTDLAYNEYPEIYSNKTMDLSDYSEFCFDMKVINRTQGYPKFTPVFKDTSWTWTSSGIWTADKEDSTWSTYCYTIDDYDWSITKHLVKQFDIQLMANDSTSNFTGTLLFDNIRVDDSVLWDFDDGYNMWKIYTESTSLAGKISVSSLFVSEEAPSPTLASTTNANLQMSLAGNQLQIQGSAGKPIQLRLLDLQGRTTGLFHSNTGFLNIHLDQQSQGVHMALVTQGNQRLSRIVSIQ